MARFHSDENLDVLAEAEPDTEISCDRDHNCDPCGMWDFDCDEPRQGVCHLGDYLRFARTVGFVGCVRAPGIHDAPTLIPAAPVVAVA